MKRIQTAFITAAKDYLPGTGGCNGHNHDTVTGENPLHMQGDWHGQLGTSEIKLHILYLHQMVCCTEPSGMLSLENVKKGGGTFTKDLAGG